MHARLLVQYSDYFLRALNSGLEESSTLKFSLTEHATSSSVGFLSAWVYGRSYLQGSALIERIGASREQYIGVHYDTWFLAEYLLIPELQSDIMSGLVASLPHFRNRNTYIVHTKKSRLSTVGCAMSRFHCMVLAARLKANQQHSRLEARERLTEYSQDMQLEIASWLALGEEQFKQESDVKKFMV